MIFIFQAFLKAVGVGTTAIVSRAYGKKDFAEAEFVTEQSLSLSIVIGLALTAAAVLTAHYVRSLTQ